MNRTLLSVGLLSSFVLPGCIVQDIRDEMRAANGQLLCVQEGLDKANTGLKDANAALAQTNERLDKVDQGLTRLDRTNALIDNVEHGLGRIDRTNASLTDLEKQLLLLRSIETSLARLDQHLTAVRKTMASLDGIVPFLDLDTGPVTDAPGVATNANPPDAGAGATDGGAPSAAPAGSEASADTNGAARAARDPLLGIWISQFPEKDHVLILQTGGRYIRSMMDKAAGPDVSYGTFVKEPGGNVSLRFTVDAATAPADVAKPRSAGAVNAKEGSSPALVAAPPFVMQVVSQGPRSLALQRDGVVYVYSRP